MFDFIRKHSKFVMVLLFLLIIPAFVVVGGLDRYNMTDAQGETVATVDGQAIKRTEWDAAHQRQVEQARAGNPQLNAAMLDTPEARYYSLENLVRERVLIAAAHKNHLTTTDAKLASLLRQDPAITKPDGTVDAARYRELVAAQNMTPAMYEARLRSELSVRQVMVGVAGTAFVPQALTDMTVEAYFGKREIQVARFSAAEFAAKAAPTDADLDTYYKANEALYRTVEQASIEYVVLNADAVKGSIVVDEKAVKSAYDAYVEAQKAAEQRRASHIMVESPASQSRGDRDKAKARAEELLAQVRKAPDSFADVARKSSQDPGSAPNGGDLDFAARGGFVAKALEDAAFSLKAKGDISNVVESEFGYHVVRLTDIRSGAVKSFEESRAGLEADYRAQQAQSKFTEIADKFTDQVDQGPDNLKQVADSLKLQLATATVARTPAAGVTGVLGNKRLLDALFTPESVSQKRSTAAVEIGPSQLAAARILQHMPARTLPFAEVKDRVRAAVTAQRATEMARKEGESKLAAWKADPAKAQMPPAIQVSRDAPAGVSPDMIEAALRADPKTLPAFVGVDMGAAGYAVIKVVKAMERGALPPEAQQQVKTQISQASATAESLAYYEVLKDRFKVKIVPAKPVVVAAAPATAPR